MMSGEQSIKNTFAIGVDIGGTHITSALFNLETQTLHLETLQRAHIDTHVNEDEIYEQWATVIKPHLLISNQIGIAMPGPFDYENGISLMNGQDKYDKIYQKNIKIGFSKFLGINDSQIQFMNDAACFLKGEMLAGAGKKFKNAIGITLGTGLGSTYYENGVANDADMWNISYKDSIAENYISSRWFTKRYQEITSEEISNVKAIVDLGDKHPIVEQLFEEFSGNLSFFINQLHQRHAGEAVIIGGSINKAHRLFLDKTKHHLGEKYDLAIPLQIAELSENAALVGAAGQWV